MRGHCAAPYCDRRFPDAPRWYLGEPKDARMRLPDDILRAVAFVGVRLGNEVVYGGTAFLTSVPFEKAPDRCVIYLVTARHVVTELQQHGDLCVRFNHKTGDARLYSIPGKWSFHRDEAVDLAAVAINIPLTVDYATYDTEVYVTDDKVAGYGIGIGDEIAMTGLFHQREGYRRNIPVLRSGVIAAMPDEPLVDVRGRSFDGYLLEVRSIGGLSGSPVFAVLPPRRPLVDGVTEPVPHALFLLGIVRGHWNQSALLSLNKKPTFLDIEQFNAGIAVDAKSEGRGATSRGGFSGRSESA